MEVSHYFEISYSEMGVEFSKFLFCKFCFTEDRTCLNHKGNRLQFASLNTLFCNFASIRLVAIHLFQIRFKIVSHSFQIRFKFASNLFHICFIFVSNSLLIRFTFALNSFQICFRFVQKFASNFRSIKCNQFCRSPFLVKVQFSSLKPR